MHMNWQNIYDVIKSAFNKRIMDERQTCQSSQSAFSKDLMNIILGSLLNLIMKLIMASELQIIKIHLT